MPATSVGETEHVLILATVPGLGPGRCARLLSEFGSAREALSASTGAWERVLGSAARQIRRAGARDLKWAAEQIAAVARHGGRVLTSDGCDYPELLREIAAPPTALFCIGAPVWVSCPCVAIVGPRQPTDYGRRMAKALGRDLAARGICVVSGMASGIDAAAHEGALAAGGPTTAVLGCGADVIYPVANAALYRRLVRRGAVVSEFPMGAVPEKGSFPRRNRIISGMSLGVILVETPARSGALITARCAVDESREVFAVPGDALSGRSAGCHGLLRDGACLVETAADVIEELAHRLPEHATQPESRPEAPAGGPLDADQATVLGLLSEGAVHVDALARGSGLQPNVILDVLLRLELEGLVEQSAGKMFRRAVHGGQLVS